MTVRKSRKTARLTALFALTLLLLAGLAPAANAQVGDVIDSVTDAVDNSSSNDSDSGSSAAPSIGEIVGDVTAGGDDGDGGGDPTKIIEDTLEDATTGAEEAGTAAESEAENTTGGTVDNLEQSTGRDLNGSLDPVTPGEGGDNTRSGSRSQSDTGLTGVGSSYGSSYGDTRSELAGLHPDRAKRMLKVTSTADSDGGIVAAIEQLAEAAVESAKKLAFPLALTVMVVGFLMVQGRVDRKDPKLALAPVTVEHDLLNFQ